MTSGGGSSGRENLPRVIFFTDNGIGLGHLSRVLAIARRGAGRFQPLILTLSLAYWLLDEWEMPAEHFPSYGHLGLTKEQWTGLITDRLAEAVAWTGAGAIVVDHVSPPDLSRLRMTMPDLELVWMRRGMWKPGKNQAALQLAGSFTTVIEPMDLASPIDQGASATDTVALRVPPITLISPDEYLPKEEARRHLGIPQDGRAVLLQLGESETESLKRTLTKARDAVIRATSPEPVHLFAPLHPLHPGLDEIPGVNCRPVYPMARYFRAFDAAVSNAGYNSYHELISSGLPVAFLIRQTRIDDQPRRAMFAEWSGRAHSAASIDEPEFQEAVARALRRHESDIAAATTRQLIQMSGAEAVADWLASQVRPNTPQVPSDSVQGVESEPVAVAGLKERLEELDGRVIVDARMIGPAGLRHLAESVRSHADKLVVLVAGGGAELTHLPLPFESVMPPWQWERVGAQFPHEEYTLRRLAGMARRYSAEKVLTLT